MIKDKNGNKIDLKGSSIREKGIYKFYVKKDRFEEMLVKLGLTFSDLNGEIEKCEFDDEFYCVYVGQTKAKDGFYSRVYHSHILGKKKSKKERSTLRKSLRAIFNFNDNDLNSFLNENSEESLFVLIDEPDESKIDFNELNAINNNGFKILNINDNGYYFKFKEYINALLKLKNLRK